MFSLQCLHSGLAKKPVKPSSFDILIADTLIAYLDTKCVTAQEAEEKLQHWGARAVRASYRNVLLLSLHLYSQILCFNLIMDILFGF